MLPGRPVVPSSTQVQTEHVSGLSALLQFNAGMAASLKDVMPSDGTMPTGEQATKMMEKMSDPKVQKAMSRWGTHATPWRRSQHLWAALTLSHTHARFYARACVRG